MSPQRMILQAQTIAETLEKIDPEHRLIYQENYQALKIQLEALDRELAAELAPYRGRIFFTYHPSFGYFAADYGLKQKAIEAGGKEPNAKDLEQWITLAQAMGIRGIIVQPQFDTRSAQVIAKAIHAEVIVVNPMNPNYPQSMRAIAQGIIQSLAPVSPQPGSAPVILHP
ncbi:MAG TPA: zinc ABC transporter substrate-binding protein, partial [Opitutales bacterium]|nr:zinc ABC transporter substrate-binding protein [Opitutales bacterium]